MLNFTLKTTATIGLVMAGAMAASLAEGVPKKQPVGRYAKLWTVSPLTERPPPLPKGEEVSELDDYTLAGVSPLEGGYSVILINKKKREDRVHLIPGMKNSKGFQVISVRQDPFSKSNTSVEIQTAAGKKGRVTYEDKFLALKAPAAVAKPPAGKAKPKTPITPPPAAKTPTTPGGPRAPRVRRVPTPPTK